MSREEKAKLVSKALKKIAATDTRLGHNEWRIIVALERAVARLEQHEALCEHLVFKGGFVLLKTTDTPRFTKDIDALAVAIRRENVPAYVQSALAKDLDDGLWYGGAEVKDLEEQGLYGAYRFMAPFQIGDPPAGHKIKKLSRIHIDIGFSDKLPLKPKKGSMRSIFPDANPVSWAVYPLEYILAEKLETFVARASANSRAKDIFDLNLLFDLCQNPTGIMRAIQKTFQNRKTEVPASFHKFAGEINLIILKPAWTAVQLMEDEVSFEDLWAQFVKNMRKLDSFG